MATEIDRLVVVFDADFKRMEDKLNRVLQKNKETKAKLDQNWAGAGFTAALEKGFDSLAEHAGEAARSIPGVGSALSALGPAGMAAAAGITAMAFALEQANAFAEMSEHLTQTAKALGMTTQQVQEFGHVAAALGIPVDALNQSLGGLSKTIGAVELGLAKANIAKAFTDVLKISPDDLKGWGDLEHQLPHILEAAEKLNAEQRAGLASKLKVDPGVLNSLIEGRDRISDLIDEAHSLGIVWDRDMVAKGEKAATTMKQMSEVIKNNLAGAFVDLLPIIDQFVKAVADAARELNLLLNEGKKLEDRNESALRSEVDKLDKARDDILRAHPDAAVAPDRGQSYEKSGSWFTGYKGGNFGTATVGASIADQLRGIGNDRRDIMEQLGKLQAQEAQDNAAVQGGAGVPPIPPKTPRARAAPEDRTATINDETRAALIASVKDVIEAQLALAGTIQERTATEMELLAEEHAAKTAEIDKKEDDIRKLKDAEDSNKANQIAALEAAKQQEAVAFALKQELLIRTAMVDALDQQLASLQRASSLQQDALSAQAAHYRAQAGLAETAAERNDLNRKALAAEQAAQDEANRSAIEQAGGAINKAAISGNANDVLTGIDQMTAAQQKAAEDQTAHQDQIAQAAKDARTPMEQYAASFKDLNTTLEQDGVNAIQSFSNALTDSLFHVKNVGEAIKNVFLNLGEEIASMALQKTLLRVLGFAEGTDSAPGGLAVVGENGPELVNLPRGAQVVPNATLAALASGGGAQMGSANRTVYMHVSSSYDMRGANGDQHIQQMIAAGNRAAVGQVMAALPKVVPGIMVEHQLQAG
jgi:hypothetical protein